MKTRGELRVLIDRIPFAEGNLGEEAIFASLLQDLRACGVSRISLLSNMARRSQLRHGDRAKVIPDRFLRWFLLPLEVAKADLLVWGGGHMLQDRSSRLYIPYVVKALLLAKLLRTHRFIYAPGMGPVLTRLGKWIAKRALKGSKVITVRDEVSADFLTSIKLGSSFQRTADPAFSLKAPADDQPRRQAGNIPIVGFAPRRHFYRKGSWFPVSWQLSSRQANLQLDRYLQEAAAALDLLIVKRGVRVRLIPMDVGPNPRDDLICYRLRSFMVNYGAAEVEDDDPPLEEFIRRLSELDLLISARLHGIILGLRFGLPFVGIDSDGKIAHFAEAMGYGDFVIRDVNFDREGLYETAMRALDGGEALRKDLFHHGAVLRSRAEQNRLELKHCLDKISGE